MEEEARWWTPDPRELQSGEREEEYLIELLMGGSAVGECKAVLARPPVADGTVGHSAERGGAAEQKAQPQGRAQEDGPATDEGSKRTAERGRERSNEEVLGGEGKSCTRTGGKEVGAWSREEPKGWSPWWSGGRKKERSHDPHQSLEALGLASSSFTLEDMKRFTRAISSE
jgi:hypothetical protein